MSLDLKQIDPHEAWRAFEPTDKQPWSRLLAAHLYRRAGFGASWTELNHAATQSPADVVGALLMPGDAATQNEASFESFDRSVVAAGNVEGLPPWWLYRMRHSRDPLLEKLTLFWHGHFATSAAKVLDIRMMVSQQRLFRDHARGQFGPLVHAISRDPAMLVYLDSSTNRKTHPNENYARELMELFCLGTGAYNEDDVQELARAFTGWEVHRKRFIYNDYEHDFGVKTILGRSGNFDGEQGIDIVLASHAAPRFIARKLVRFFVCDEPAWPEALIEPLAIQLRETDYDLGSLVKTILSSHLFYSHVALGRKVRSPVELAIGLLRALETQTNFGELSNRLAELGQRLFYPPNVAGWRGGRTWINSSTLIGRANLVGQIVRSADLTSLIDAAGADSNEEIVDWALELLVAVKVPQGVRQSLIGIVGRKQDNHARIADLLHAIGSLPEFQLN
jgi:uncharacterized protein (DUF1800 family)